MIVRGQLHIGVAVIRDAINSRLGISSRDSYNIIISMRLASMNGGGAKEKLTSDTMVCEAP